MRGGEAWDDWATRARPNGTPVRNYTGPAKQNKLGCDFETLEFCNPSTAHLQRALWLQGRFSSLMVNRTKDITALYKGVNRLREAEILPEVAQLVRDQMASWPGAGRMQLTAREEAPGKIKRSPKDH